MNKFEAVYGVIDIETYPYKKGRYAFQTPDSIEPGDVMEDAGQAVTVINLDTEYEGEIRTIHKSGLHERRKQRRQARDS